MRSGARAMVRLCCVLSIIAIMVAACRDHTPTQTVTAIGTKANICFTDRSGPVSCACRQFIFDHPGDPLPQICFLDSAQVMLSSGHGPRPSISVNSGDTVVFFATTNVAAFTFSVAGYSFVPLPPLAMNRGISGRGGVLRTIRGVLARPATTASSTRARSAISAPGRSAQLLPGVTSCRASTDSVCFDVFTTSGYEIISATVDGVSERDSLLVTVAPPPDSLTVTSVAGSNAGGSFTSLAREDTLSLNAKAVGLGPSPQLLWMIADDSIGQLTVIPPNSMTAGLMTSVTVPAQSSSRYATLTAHPAPLSKLALRFVVTASSVPPQPAIQSAPDTIVQSELDAMREEYAEYKIAVPPHSSWYTQQYPRVTAPGPITQLNFGDYTWSYIDPDLPTELNALQNLRQRTLTLISAFRDPLHQRLHIRVAGGTSPTAPAQLSQHQYGSAADIYVNNDSVTWSRMRALAGAANPAVCIEPWAKTHATHLHVHYNVACDPLWKFTTNDR
jgi:hypothetical protein